MKIVAFLLFSFFQSALLAQNATLVVPCGHAGNVGVLSITPDNKYLASGSWDKTVKIWDFAGGRELKTLANYPSWVKVLGFAPDGNKLITVSRKEVRINDMRSGVREIFRKEIAANDIDAIAFTADSRIIATANSVDNVAATGGTSFEVKLWNLSDMTLLKKITGKGNIRSMFFQNNNDLIGVGQNQIVHFEISTGTVKTVEEFPGGITGLSPDGRFTVKDGFVNVDNNLFSIDGPKSHATLEVRDRKTKRVLTTFEGQTASIKTVGFSPDSRYVATGADDNTIFIYDLEQMKFAGKLTSKMSYPAGITFTNDGEKILCGNYDKVIRVWDFNERKLIRKLGGVANIIYDISLSPDNNSLAVYGNPNFNGEGGIQIVDLKSGNLTKKYDASSVGKIKYSPDGKYLVAGSFKGKSTIFSVTGNDAPVVLGDGIKMTDFDFSPDGKFIASTNYDNSTPELTIRNFPSGTEVNTFRLPYGTGPVLFSSDGRSVYAGLRSDDRTVKLDISTGKILQSFRHAGQYNSVTGMRVLMESNDGKSLITADDYSHLRWWDVSTGKETGITITPHGERMNHMIPLNAGKTQLITAAGESSFADTLINFIDVATGKKLRSFAGHTNSPSSLAVTRNSKFLFSGGFDRTVKLWDIATGKVLATMVFFGGTDWVVVDGEGRFDGTEAGMKQMYYVKGLEVIPLESAYEKFYTPGLIPRIMGGENFTPPVVKITTLKPAPTVKLGVSEQQRNLVVEDSKEEAKIYTTVNETIDINVQADCPEDGVAEIRLYRDGKLVQTTRNLEVTDDKSEQHVVKSFSVTLNSGENRFKAIAFNTQRTESKAEEIIVRFKGISNIPVASAPNLNIIVVGINNYKNPKYNLNYAGADAESFRRLMETKTGGIFGKVKVDYLSDAGATKEKISAVFRSVAAASTAKDVFIFYYAGHGVMNSADNKKKDFYIVPYDVTQLYGADDALAQKGISAAELQEFSKNIPAQKQLFILDACQSAGALEAIASRGAAEEKAIAQLARSTGTHWLTASGSDQFASEFGQLGHGIFTFVLLKALTEGTGSGDNRVSVNGLKAYLESQVPELSQKYKGTAQYPASYGYGNDFPLILVK